jgi:hypothetical protein
MSLLYNRVHDVSDIIRAIRFESFRLIAPDQTDHEMMAPVALGGKFKNIRNIHLEHCQWPKQTPMHALASALGVRCPKEDTNVPIRWGGRFFWVDQVFLVVFVY